MTAALLGVFGFVAGGTVGAIAGIVVSMARLDHIDPTDADPRHDDELSTAVRIVLAGAILGAGAGVYALNALLPPA